MSLERPASVIKLFNVPWTKGDNNLLKFSSVNQQTSKMNSYINNQDDKFIGEHYNIIRDGVIQIDANVYAVNKYNYMQFTNPDISSTREFWYAFIDRVEWLSYNSCNVYYSLDAWQNYQFDIEFKKCFVERSHVANDTIGKWLAPEPISVTPQYEKKISIDTGTSFDSLDWTPQWVLHSTSKPVTNNGKVEYEYKGTGSGGTLTAEYGFFVDSTSDIQSIVESYGRKSMEDVLSQFGSATTTMWENITNWISDLTDPDANYTHEWQAVQGAVSLAEVQDHRNELIGLYAIPKWLKGSSSTPSNHVKSQAVTLALDTTKMACGYEPRNQKMLTSMCKGYSIYTENGFKIALKPELFTSSKPSVTLYANQMGTDGFILKVGNYANPSNSCHRLNYACQSRLGYDANTGLDKTLNQLSTAIGAVGTVANIAGSASAGNYLGVAQGVGSAIQNATNMIDAIGQRGVNTGSSGNLLSITGTRPIPQIVDISPNREECEYIDSYLDVYGYAINEVQSINITSRPSWNYIKVTKLNATIKAPDQYAQVIMNAFQSGCHIWHTEISDVGNFGLNNRLPS